MEGWSGAGARIRFRRVRCGVPIESTLVNSTEIFAALKLRQYVQVGEAIVFKPKFCDCLCFPGESGQAFRTKVGDDSGPKWANDSPQVYIRVICA
jgi:hypothetical protein